MKKRISGPKFRAPKASKKTAVLLIISAWTGLEFATVREYMIKRQDAWTEFVNARQAEIERQTKNGYGIRAWDGCRVPR